MKLESTILIEAPVPVVFRFYRNLDHLRFVSPTHRREWCPARGLVLSEGTEQEVRVRQGRHGLALRFRTIRLDLHKAYEDEFLSWPLAGARHVQTFTEQNGGQATWVCDTNLWDPPWFARAIVSKHEAQQVTFFEEKLRNAKRLIESVYQKRGEEAFTQGIFSETEPLGIAPIIQDDED